MKSRGTGMAEVAGALAALVVVVAFGYVLWSLGRKVNYAWAYRDLVKQTIRAEVKAECLAR